MARIHARTGLFWGSHLGMPRRACSRYSQAYSLVDSSDAMLSLAASLQQQVVLYVRGSVKFLVHAAFVLISQPDLLNLGSSKRR